MYAKGTTTGDIETHIQEIYSISVSDSTFSRIMDKILPVVKEWHQRLLEAIYYHVRREGQTVKKAVYSAISFIPFIQLSKMYCNPTQIFIKVSGKKVDNPRIMWYYKPRTKESAPLREWWNWQTR